MPAVASAALKASIELTLPAATALQMVMVTAAPAAGVNTNVVPLSELVPPLVRSAAVPATARAPAPVGAAVVAEAFTEYPTVLCSTWLAIDLAVSTSFCSEVMTGVGGLQDLHAVADAIEQIADVAGAVVERGRGEIVGRVVEGRVDLLAGREAILGGGKQIGGRLQREQVLANRRRENNTGHGSNLPGLCPQFYCGSFKLG